MVGNGTLIYLTGGPTGGPPRQTVTSCHCGTLCTSEMIRQGVLTWGQLQSLEDVRLLNALPRTWKGVYNHGGRLLNKVPSQGGFDTPTVHAQN